MRHICVHTVCSQLYCLTLNTIASYGLLQSGVQYNSLGCSTYARVVEDSVQFGKRWSMDLPFSKVFSISMRSSTPSTTACTSSTCRWGGGRVSVYMSDGVYSGYFAVVTAYYTVPAHLGVTQPVTVGDVIDTTLCGRVHSPSPAFLQLHLFQ